MKNTITVDIKDIIPARIGDNFFVNSNLFKTENIEICFTPEAMSHFVASCGRICSEDALKIFKEGIGFIEWKNSNAKMDLRVDWKIDTIPEKEPASFKGYFPKEKKQWTTEEVITYTEWLFENARRKTDGMNNWVAFYGFEEIAFKNSESLVDWYIESKKVKEIESCNITEVSALSDGSHGVGLDHVVYKGMSEVAINWSDQLPDGVRLITNIYQKKNKEGTIVYHTAITIADSNGLIVTVRSDDPRSCNKAGKEAIRKYWEKENILTDSDLVDGKDQQYPSVHVISIKDIPAHDQRKDNPMTLKILETSPFNRIMSQRTGETIQYTELVDDLSFKR